MSPLPIEISCEEVHALRRQGVPFLLLDCREQDEYDRAAISGAVLLPMSQLQDRIAELESHRDSRIVVHCHHGGRSLRVARWMQGQNFPQVQSMAGGIEVWATQIDPSIPRY